MHNSIHIIVRLYIEIFKSQHQQDLLFRLLIKGIAKIQINLHSVMRIFRYFLTTYFVFVSLQCIIAGRQRVRLKCFRNSKRAPYLWRLKLLRKISEKLKPKIDLLSIKDRNHRTDLSFGKLRMDSLEKHVPEIYCKQRPDTKEDLVACPTPDKQNRFHCISSTKLCNRLLDCPNGEDEDLTACMFHAGAFSLYRTFTNSIHKLDERLKELEDLESAK